MSRDQDNPRKPRTNEVRGWHAAFRRNFSGPLAGLVLGALSAWMILTGIKGLAGFEVTRNSVLADLIGIALVFALARWIALRPDSR